MIEDRVNDKKLFIRKQMDDFLIASILQPVKKLPCTLKTTFHVGNTGHISYDIRAIA